MSHAVRTSSRALLSRRSIASANGWALVIQVASVLLTACALAPTEALSAPRDVVYSFQGDKKGGFSYDPAGPLAFDATGTMLYGITEIGGQYGKGTLFSVSLQGVHTVLHSFGGQKGDGAYPIFGVTLIDGALYGTTSRGGRSGNGTVWQLSPGGVYTVLYAFRGNPDGAYPAGTLTTIGGDLYGTTVNGGNGYGTVFKISPANGQVSVLYAFKGGAKDGAGPWGPLTALDDLLYGTTSGGGPENSGSVFKLTLSGRETVLHLFTGGADGQEPLGGVIALNGALYGTTALGGGSTACSGHGGTGCGTVFAISRRGVELVLHTFSGADGAYPDELISIDRKLYGTAGGGAANDGLAYSMTLQGSEKVLHTFRGGHDGGGPINGLISDQTGYTLYGVTANGGSLVNCGSGCGVVFSTPRH